MNTKRWSEEERLLQVATRYNIHQTLQVQTKTIGTNISFYLLTKNISNSGLLLMWETRRSLPFKVNTLLEINFNLSENNQMRVQPSWLGKVVRRVEVEELERKILLGIQIVSLVHNEQGLWEDFVEVIEQEYTKQVDQTKVHVG